MDVAKLGERASGVLLHITSLPGLHGNGDLGAEARQFVDFLYSAEQSFWQMLPVGPTGYGNSPYSAQSAFAGNPLLIALPAVQRAGYLDARTLARLPRLPDRRVDYAAAEGFRTACLRRAFQRAKGSAGLRRYRERESAWLDDYALYRALKRAHGETAWTDWPAELRDRKPAALKRARRTLAAEIGAVCFEQWQFDRQWGELRAYSHERGIALIGDIPIFVAHDSADVWQHRELFHLDARGTASVVAGVPPDYFSATGQRWGNPLYRWPRLKRTGYKFWVDRMHSMLTRFDIVRLDHFIGFERYWEIPGSESTAIAGRWVKGPGSALFRTLARELGSLPLIAEDLGVVTDEVKALRDRFGLPGIRLLQFAFGDDPSAPDFLPHNYSRRSVVYTGTHDNDTTQGWFWEADASSTRSREQIARERAAVLNYLGCSNSSDIHWQMIRMCMLSVADTAIFPMQDLLGLGSEARMNQPGRAGGNWEWRMSKTAINTRLARRLAELTRRYGRQRPRARTAVAESARREDHAQRRAALREQP